MATYYVDGTRPDDSGSGASEALAKKTIQAGFNLLSKGDTLYIKASGTYTISSGVTTGGTSSYDGKTMVVGYGTTPGDGTKPTIRPSTGMTMFNLSTAGFHLQSLEIDGNSVSSVTGVSLAAYTAMTDCLIRRCVTGVSAGGDTVIGRCEVTACTTAAITAAGRVTDCWVHDNTCTGIATSTGNIVVVGCVVSNNTGASSDGIAFSSSGYSNIVRNCTVHGNGRHGISLTSNFVSIVFDVSNNLITSNGGYGLLFASSWSGSASPQIDYNAFRSNTSGARSNALAGAHDVTLSADPYVAAGSNDFRLNSTAGGGAACRAVGFPGTIGSGGTGVTGYGDIGALQHQDSGGGPVGQVNRVTSIGTY